MWMHKIKFIYVPVDFCIYVCKYTLLAIYKSICYTYNQRRVSAYPVSRPATHLTLVTPPKSDSYPHRALRTVTVRMPPSQHRLAAAAETDDVTTVARPPETVPSLSRAARGARADARPFCLSDGRLWAGRPDLHLIRQRSNAKTPMDCRMISFYRYIWYKVQSSQVLVLVRFVYGF